MIGRASGLILAIALVPLQAARANATFRFDTAFWKAFDESRYPVEAMIKGEEGRVVVDVEVAANGRALRCEIVESSSSSSLDATTCQQAMTLTFKPGLSPEGMAVVDRARIPVRWSLPKARILSEVTIVRAGDVARCRAKWSGKPRRLRDEVCAYLASETTDNRAQVALSEPLFAPR